MSWDDKHPCPSCGKMHKESETLSKCTRIKCGQIYCGDYNCGNGKGCPECRNEGSVPVTWNPILKKWC